MKLIECVPNFSEGRNQDILNQISNSIKNVRGVTLLDFDQGKDTNRTVVTFVGDPDSVIEAAFNAIKIASKLIDMRLHEGEHPRMGSTDVCPLIPVANVTMDECIEYSKKLSKLVGSPFPKFSAQFSRFIPSLSKNIFLELEIPITLMFSFKFSFKNFFC